MKFLSGLGLGLRIQLSEKADFMASIGGSSIDFTPAMRSIQYEVPSDVEVPAPNLGSFAVLKFGIVILLGDRD